MNRNILAVEDEPDALANLQDILELDGFDVVGTSTLREAAAGRRWSDFAVILLDRRLPDGSAEDILPTIHREAPQTAVIVITGHADLEGTIAALRAGAADYLLKPVNPDLLRAAVSRAIRLREMEDRLIRSERLAAIGQMIAMLTHESGNLLGRGNAYLDMLQSEVEDRPAAIELINKVQRSHADLQRLHEEVRNYAAPIELDCERWNLATIWRQTWRNVTAEVISGKPPELVERIGDVDLTCECDAFRLDQVFRNLFDNAVAACPAMATIEICCDSADLLGRPAIRIAVRDNGKGLTPAEAERVFAPFYTTKPKGTGLGLAIVARIVEAHGGAVAVRSRPGEGAEFVVTLPRRQSTEEQSPNEPSSRTTSHQEHSQQPMS